MKIVFKHSLYNRIYHPHNLIRHPDIEKNNMQRNKIIHSLALKLRKRCCTNPLSSVNNIINFRFLSSSTTGGEKIKPTKDDYNDRIYQTAVTYPHHFPVSISINNYINKYKENLNAGQKCSEHSSINLAGRIHSIRTAGKKLYFIDLHCNGKSLQVLSDQQYYECDSNDKFHVIHSSLRRGDIIGVQGFPGKSLKGELSIIPRSIQLLSPCVRPFPNSKFGIKDPTIRFKQRYLDLLCNQSTRHVFETRSKIIRYIRRYLEDNEFTEVETPILSSRVGGASAMPFHTNSRALGTDLHLRIAPELYLKQLVIGGIDRVFEIGKVFRNEGIDSSHNPEFTICEYYEAYADYYSLMDRTEEMLSGLVKSITGSYKLTISTSSGEHEIDFSKPFPRISMIEAIQNKLGETLPDLDNPKAIELLQEICQKHNILCPPPLTVARIVDRLIGECLEDTMISPTFLCDHPTCLSPLAKSHREHNGKTERFELYIGGKEICNAYTELNDPTEQRQRFAQQQMDKQKGDLEAQVNDEEFCTALEYGLPPTGGFGIGIDRLVMLLTGKKHIRDVIFFPTMKPLQIECSEE